MGSDPEGFDLCELEVEQGFGIKGKGYRKIGDIRSGREKADDWGLFCEVNRRRRSRRGIRETIPNHPTAVGVWMHQWFGLSKTR